jgi:hypothetical protein
MRVFKVPESLAAVATTSNINKNTDLRLTRSFKNNLSAYFTGIFNNAVIS